MRKKKHKKKNKNMKKREIQKMQVENQQEVLGADVDKNQVENQQEILVDAAEKEQRRTTRLGAIIAIVLAVILLYASGFVSASEIAFFSLSPGDLSEIEEGQTSSDRRISALLDDSEHLLATILISNNFVNVTIIMLCNYFFASTIHWGNSVILEFLVITVILTFLLLLFGEIMPKHFQNRYRRRTYG